MLRRTLFCLLALVFFSPVFAHADDFTFVPNSGNTTYSFTLGTSANYTQTGNDGAELGVFYANSNTLAFYVLNSIYSDDYARNGYGEIDAILVDGSSGVSYYLIGPQLFTGDPASPQFIRGTYNLAASSYGGVQDGNGGTLTISSAATPEPSSLALLGTGLFSVVGVARRKYSAV